MTFHGGDRTYTPCSAQKLEAQAHSAHAPHWSDGSEEMAVDTVRAHLARFLLSQATDGGRPSRHWAALAGCAALLTGAAAPSLAGDDDQRVAHPAIALAKAHLQERLEIQEAEIAVKSVELLAFPRPSRDPGAGARGPAPESSGYLITLTASGSAFEYHGKILGRLHILWHERGTHSETSK